MGSSTEPRVAAATRRERLDADIAVPPDRATELAPNEQRAGRLRVTVLDAANGIPVAAVSNRIASETRLARVNNQNPLDVRVSAGTYHMGVHAEGFDSLILGPTPVDEDAVTDLGNVLMSRGSGVIEGRVVAGGKPVPGCEVELHRGPASPSSVRVDDDGRFRFGSLAACATWRRGRSVSRSNPDTSPA